MERVQGAQIYHTITKMKRLQTSTSKISSCDFLKRNFIVDQNCIFQKPIHWRITARSGRFTSRSFGAGQCLEKEVHSSKQLTQSKAHGRRKSFSNGFGVRAGILAISGVGFLLRGVAEPCRDLGDCFGKVVPRFVHRGSYFGTLVR